MFRWIDAHKNSDSFFVNFLKMLYSLGKIQWLYTIIITALGLSIPILFENQQYSWVSILSVFWVFVIVFHSICLNYQKKQYKQRVLPAQVLDNHSSLINTLNIEIKSNPQWRSTIFKKISEIVCEKIQRVFIDTLNCNTRVSVEYVFDKKDVNNKMEKYVKMAGRRSPNRDTCKKSVLLKKRDKYYSYKIFTDNKLGINFLPEEEIRRDNVWYKNPSHENNVKKYIGIAVSVLDDVNVDYILQIDCLDEVTFEKNNTPEEVALFINQYLKAYINTISLSYLLNLNKTKKISEV